MASPGPLAEEVRRRARRHAGRQVQGGLDRLRRRRLGLRARSRWRASCRASGSRWSPTRPTGTRSACPRSTAWCCCRCPRPTRAPRRCCPARSTGSKRPSPDAMGTIQARGNKIYFNQQPHVWPWQLSFAEGSPWLDKRVRHAANLCVDRAGPDEAAGRHDGRAQGHGAAGPPVVGQPQVRHPLRRARRAEADDRSRLQRRQAAEGEGADLAPAARARCSRCR